MAIRPGIVRILQLSKRDFQLQRNAEGEEGEASDSASDSRDTTVDNIAIEQSCRVI